MSQPPSFTTLVIQDPSGGQPQMIKVMGNVNGKLPFQLAATSSGGAPTIKRIIRAAPADVTLGQDGKIQNRQFIALPQNKTIGVSTIRGPLVVPMNSVALKSSSFGEEGSSRGPPSIASPVVISAPSISTSLSSQSPARISFNPSRLPPQVKQIVTTPNGITIKQEPQQTRIQKTPENQDHIRMVPATYHQSIQVSSGENTAPNAPGSPTKLLMNSSILDHSGARKRHEINYNIDYNNAGKRRKTEKCGKGLRHFSMKVCEKVKAKGTTSYNEVADELVTEVTQANANSTADSINYDQKNIRRRVYDALNVLMAMNIISKEKKEIKWLGLPTNSAQECNKLDQERTKAQQRIRLKTQQLQDLILQQIAFKSLVERNREREAAAATTPYMQTTIQLPFIIVNTSKKTVIDCCIAEDKREYTLGFDDAFRIHDDIEILKHMGMALGLEKGGSDPELIEKAKRMVPQALASYVEELGRDGCMSGEKGSMDVMDEGYDRTEFKDTGVANRGRLSRHSSMGSLVADMRTESATPSSLGDEDEDSDMDTL